ncbi:MAG: DNA topoisomerase III [Christensenellales bacterium]
MILVVAEKPSVGRDISRVLGCTQKGDGHLSGGDYIVTWAFGHLVTLMEPDEVDERYKKWRMEDLPILPEIIPTKIIPKTKSQYLLIKRLMLSKEVERLICATDAGREGELIFGLIYEMAGCAKPVDRLWISSMTDAAIKEGFDSLKPRSAYTGLYRSALCRSQADWLVGMNASRAFTLKYNALLSLGRVQTPTLALLVRRAREIRDFVPEEYYTLRADFGDYQGLWFDPAIKEEKLNSRLPGKAAAEEKAKRVRHQPARVASLIREEKREPPPQLYDLTTLQRDANKRLGFTADKTLKVAQSLYETRKAITYPRTDSRYLPHDMVPRVYKTMEALAGSFAGLLQFIEKEEGKLPFSKRIYDDSKVSDHHAIIPTPQKIDPAKLSGDERALYQMVVSRLIAAFCPAHVYEAARVVTVAGGESFKTTGKTVLVPGWKQVYQDAQKEEGEEAPLPALAEGDVREVVSAAIKKEATKPPPPHNDASLLLAMENAGKEVDDEALREQMKGSGLGTPATRAAIIERLIQVGYALRRGKALNATEKGEQLIAVAPEEIASPEMTGRWELALEEIARGKQDRDRFMQGIRALTAFLVNFARDQRAEVHFEQEVRGKRGKVRAAVKPLPEVTCPLCGQPVQENDKAFGCAAWREGCAFTLWKDALSRAGGPTLNTAIVTRLLKEGRVEGSTGTLGLQEGQLIFTRRGAAAPSAAVSIRYQKKAR